jgi:hypothetical protein
MPRERDIATFVNRVLTITTREEARQFWESELTRLRANHPEITDPERVLRSNIGWCFGEGMKVPQREMWVLVRFERP